MHNANILMYKWKSSLKWLKILLRFTYFFAFKKKP